MSKFIGFSFGCCVRDIAKGLVRIEEVEVIYSNLSCISEETLRIYYKPRWPKMGVDPDRCEAIARELLAGGKVALLSRESPNWSPKFWEKGTWQKDGGRRCDFIEVGNGDFEFPE
jgi:hypothetical protein